MVAVRMSAKFREAIDNWCRAQLINLLDQRLFGGLLKGHAGKCESDELGLLDVACLQEFAGSISETRFRLT